MPGYVIERKRIAKTQRPRSRAAPRSVSSGDYANDGDEPGKPSKSG
jgi:hypothetical protein